MPASSRTTGPIVVGVDFSKASHMALERALHLARRLRAPLEVVHVTSPIDPALPFSRENRAVAARLQREALALAERELTSFVPSVRGVRVRTVVRSGLPHKQLLAHAEEVRAEMIVIANRGHTLAERLLLGSVADRVARKSAIPVLLVPPVAPRRSRPKA